MSALATIEPDIACGRLFDDDDDEPRSLDELIAGTWRELSSHRAGACPACGEEMAPTYGAHALPTGGRCRSCAAELR